MTFSCLVHESLVQFVEPVSTVWPVANGELVVHEVGDTGDRPRRHGQRRDVLRHARRRRRDGDRIRVVDVVREPDSDATRCDAATIAPATSLLDLRPEVEVVEGEVQARRCGADERGDLFRDLGHGLTAVRQRPACDHGAIMDFVDVLRRRKAVRSYLDEPIPRETLERIVERGRKIPSAGHSQGLRLVVVTDGRTRKAIADIADEDTTSSTGMSRGSRGPPAHIVVGVREADYHDRYREADKLMDGGRRSSGRCRTGTSTPGPP